MTDREPDPRLAELPEGMREIRVVSSADGSAEPCLFRPAPGGEAAPLLVGLHTWSYDRFNAVETLGPLAARNGWHLLLPEFRGPNRQNNPRRREACGSARAVQDVIDAVGHVGRVAPVDPAARFLAGVSGGGHMALLVAAKAPALFRAVVAFCPITDLAAWHAENPAYAGHVAACCGGPPGAETEGAYRERSPVAHARALGEAEVTLLHGKFDPVVSCAHALRLYRAVAESAPEARLFLEIFDGGHEMPLERLEAAIRARLDPPPLTEEATG